VTGPPATATPPVIDAQACEPIRAEPPPLIESTIDTLVPAIIDAEGAMVPFYKRVAELIRGTAKDHVRIGVFGDSNMTMDWITGEMRRTLQGRYGDGGHGYVALGRPWLWYKHMDIRSGDDPRDFKPDAVSTHPAPDRCYGFAGIAAYSQRAGAKTWVETAEQGAPIGTSASRFTLFYLRKPGGGSLDIRVDNQVVSSVHTDNPTLEGATQEFTANDGPHRVEFVATSVNPVVLFGVSLEREKPSVIVDSLGVGAVSGPLLLRQNADVMRASLAARKYDLIVLLLGSNQVWPKKYEEWMGELVQRFRQALPNATVLVMTPVDQVKSVRSWRSLPDLALVARQNRNVALQNDCAFWDFRGAMGGDASMTRFMATGMGQADGIHLTPKGASYMGRRIVHALWRGLDGYLQANPAAGCPTGETTRR
jgi:lysophospholipase L1-like esterase